MPEIKTFDFEPHLYFEPAHALTQTNERLHSFYLFRENRTKPVAVFHCSKQANDVWISPPNAPFGGIQCADDCSADELAFFLHFIKSTIFKQGANKLIIKSAPTCYEPKLADLLTQCYVNTNFLAIRACTNTFIPVSFADFRDRIVPAEQRRLRKARRCGLTAGLANKLPSALIYRFLTECRAQQGYCISLTLNQVETLRSQFPENFSVFVVRDALKIIALTLTVRVNKRVLYNFLCSYLPEYRAHSPTVILLETVYNYCRQEKIEILDLGISVDDQGNFKPSLHRFKRNVGGQDCLKITYEIDF
ncbi:GNAT family N-acetyltransferase [Dyadobacter sp. CY326]|uniref:GNAT family N-acetyltransferase n=1 Tax=Dyadobacter sp. CY326 TaxID=2907300 RepID=UPI001F23AD30|nr:GNAT family N-acetyltransferase [Dyadobacter sp. CY326]MCE7065569.1 GNAT family N-acetyltransferase [Dyadobacter sp. CY326]